MLKIFTFIILSELCYTVGQIFYKKAAVNLDVSELTGWRSYWVFIKQVLSRPLIWAGLLWLGIAILFWLMALAEGDLSLVFPLSSIQYILTLVGASIFLKEKIDRMKIAGTVLVAAGIILIAQT